jgi:hypothetical protein
MCFFRHVVCVVAAISLFMAVPSAAQRPRLAVLTDIGGDPDDQQSMIRLMVYSNEFDLELLIATAAGTPGELKESTTRPDLIRQIIDAYGEVSPNLQRHAKGWPAVESLRARVISGNHLRGRKHIGAGHDTAASRALIGRVDAGTADRPLNIAVWGGQTDLAQALWRVKQDRGTPGFATFVRKLRVYDIADQDGIADWMRAEFPGMHYILAKAPAGRDRRDAVFRGMYLTGDESLTSRAWLDEHVRTRGPLGALYPTKTWTAPNPHGSLKEGDTPSWFFFLPIGGNNPADPSKPGWGGQFVRESDGWFRDHPAEAGKDPRESVSRWRPDFQRDFAKRMAWCAPAKPPYPPSPVIARVEFAFDTHQRHAPGSDNWPTTWADDGHLYSAWGDGGGFGGTNSKGRVLLGVARIEGDAAHYVGKNIWGGFGPERPSQFGGKSYGILSVDGVLYMWVAPQPNPHLDYGVFLNRYPSGRVSEFDRRVAPGLALCVAAVVVVGLAGYWLAYLWSGEGYFEFGP